MLTLGVDGCPGGWVAALLEAPGGCEGPSGASLRWAATDSLEPLLKEAAGEADLALIDVPIGLTEGPGRPCDAAARRLLGPKASSVFTPPMRAMLDMPDWATANAYGKARRVGGGVSRQSWNILPKVREADAAMTPALQARVREGHPEVAFARLAGGPVRSPKSRTAGRAERLSILDTHGLDARPMIAALARGGAAPARPDDVLDACVLALAARQVLRDGGRALGGERDARGLRMEIVG